jgi:hypothetical protein
LTRIAPTVALHSLWVMIWLVFGFYMAILLAALPH